MSKITFTERAFEEYLYRQTTDRKKLRRINELLRDISRSPYEGFGKPEGLRQDLRGYWSRRIDEVNRLVYRVAGDQIEVYQCKGHYEDRSCPTKRNRPRPLQEILRFPQGFIFWRS